MIIFRHQFDTHSTLIRHSFDDIVSRPDRSCHGWSTSIVCIVCQAVRRLRQLGDVDIGAKDHVIYILDGKLMMGGITNPSGFAVNCVKNAFIALGVALPQ